MTEPTVTKSTKKSSKTDAEVLAITTQISQLSKLSMALGSAGKQGYLELPMEGSENGIITFGDADRRAAIAALKSSILKLATDRKVKPVRKVKNTPIPGNFLGTYAPVYMGDPLRKLFADAKAFGRLDPSNPKSPNLLDSLPQAKNGFLMRTTLSSLMFIYGFANSLNTTDKQNIITPNKAMNDAFGKTPATFYKFPKTNKLKKILLTEAAKQKLVDGKSSSYALVAIDNPGTATGAKGQTLPAFTPDQFHTYFYQNLASLNYFTDGDLSRAFESTGDAKWSGLQAKLNDPKIREAILNEYNLVKETSRRWKELRKQK